MAFDLSAARAALRARVASTAQPRALILTHDNPDPDSIAAALGLRRLLEADGFGVTLALGGIIGRAENRAMVKELRIPLVPLERLDLSTFQVVGLVDTQPKTGNNSLPDDRPPDIVIDHHPAREASNGVLWRDIRDEVGATATIVFEYLKSAGLELDTTLSTAFLYALKSETRDLGREAGPDERDAYIELMATADFARLYAISHPKLGREHFVAVDRAIRHAVVWGDLLAVNVGDLDYPDLVAEVADLMLPYDRARWVICVGQHENSVYLSLRTDVATANAGQVIRRVLGARGAGGGHGMIAGGRLFAEVRDDAELKSIYDELVARLLEELKISATPAPLI
jgi:nanoRNase/pAp phosphatase (c-di-AMP/oligoRNAs hydrolase)